MAAVTTVGSNKRERRRTVSQPSTDSHQPVTHFLIASLAIRNGRKFCAPNKNPVSNRLKNGIFQPPVTYNLKPATFLPDRNCKELKTDVTL